MARRFCLPRKKCLQNIKKPCRMMTYLTSPLKRMTSSSFKFGKDVWKHEIYRWMAVAYFVTFFILLPLLCQKLPNSLFFIQPRDLEYEKGKVWKRNDINAVAAKDYVTRESDALGRDINLTASRYGNYPVSNSVVIITVISVSRANSEGHQTKYLTQTVAKTHRLLKEFHGTSSEDFFQMAICNVDSQPMDNTEAKFLSEALHIPLMNRFAKYGLGQSESRSVFEKEKNDYAYCLNESLKYRPSYVLLLEDDAILVDNAVRTLHHMLTHSFEYFFTTKQRQETAYIKLYHPMRLLSFFSYEVERIPELLALGAIFGSISLLILSQWTKVIDKIGLHRLWVFTIIYFTLFFFCIGRSNLLKMREFSKHFYQMVPAPDCCTPAMLFPNSSAHTLVKYLHQTTSRSGYAKDYILETFKQDTRLVGRMISPNLVEHIGMFSSLRRKTINPFIVN